MHGSIDGGNEQDLLINKLFFQCLLNVVNVVFLVINKAI